MATTTVNPYDAYKTMYDQRTKAIEAQTKQAETERIAREKQAQQTLESSNRGVYTTYKQATNPYGSFASQRNLSGGVSNFYNNAAYGTMLKGIGANQYNYNDAMNNSNSLWQNYLTQKAGQEADALTDYNNAVIGQQKYDKEQEIAEQERQEALRQFNIKLQMQQEEAKRQAAADAEAIRQYNLNLKLQQDKMAADAAARAQEQKNYEAEQAEAKRRYDQEWAYQLEQNKLAQAAASRSSSGGGGGGSRRSSGGSSSGGFDFGDLGDLTAQPTAQTASYRHEQNGTTNNNKPNIVKVEHKASGVKGKKYKITYYSDGTRKYDLVNA